MRWVLLLFVELWDVSWELGLEWQRKWMVPTAPQPHVQTLFLLHPCTLHVKAHRDAM